MAFNPYDIDIESLKESREITDPVEILKYQLGSQILGIVIDMETSDIIAKTGLDKSDISRLKINSALRFSITRLLKILNSLGYKATIKITKNNNKVS